MDEPATARLNSRQTRELLCASTQILRSLVLRFTITVTHRERRGAPPARRDDRAYREYVVRHEGAEDQWMKDPPE